MRRFSLLLIFSLLLMLMPAQAWAGFTLDVNGDGQIHLDDVVQTLIHQGAVDVNGDGRVDADDLRTLLAQTSGGAQTGSVSGTVTDEWGNPVAGAYVSLDGTPRSTVTDSQGGFLLSGISFSLGNRLTVSKSGYTNGGSQSFSVLAGVSRTLSPIRIAHRTGSVTGFVYSPQHASLAETTVSVAGLPLSTHPDAAGSFTITGVPIGPQTIVATGASGTVNSVVNVIEGSAVSIGTLVFPELSSTGVTVTGAVYNQQGVGLYPATVTAALVDAGGSVSAADYSASTSEDGSFQLANMPAGTYELQASADGFTSQSLQLTVTESTYSALRFELQPLDTVSGTVTGTVYDVAGPVITGASVALVDDTGHLQLRTTTDSEGRYRFDYVPANHSFFLFMDKDGFVQGNLADMTVSAGVYAVEPAVYLLHVATASTLGELVAAKDDPYVGEIRLTADISTLTNGDPADDALTFSDVAGSGEPILLTSDVPVTLEASSFTGEFNVVGDVYLQANIGSDLGLLEDELWTRQANRIVLDGIAGYSGTLERQRSAIDYTDYYTYTEADGSRTAFIASGESLQAALHDSVVNAVYVDGYVSWANTLTFPSRPLALHTLSGNMAEVLANHIAGYDPALVTLDNVNVADTQPPIVSGMESTGSTVTIHFDEFGSILADTAEVSNPWQRGIIFKDHDGHVIPYAATDFWSLSDNGKDLTLTFAQNFAAGDLLEFTDAVRDVDYNSMTPVAWKFDGSAWAVSPDADGSASITIDQIASITYQNGYFSAQGTASDADGDVYLDDIRLALYSNAAGQYARYDEATGSLIFDSATPNFNNAYGVMEGDNDGLFHWYGSFSYAGSIPNGTYTVVAAVYKNDQMRAVAQTDLVMAVKPIISYYEGHTLPIGASQAAGVMTDHNGTLYLVRSDLGTAFTPDTLESAYSDLTNAGKIAKMTADMYSSNELNTAGLTTGDYNLFLVADHEVSDPVLFHLVDGPTVDAYLNPLYGGVTYPFSYSDIGAVYGYSNVEGTVYLVPDSVALGDVPAYIAAYEGDTTKLSQANMSYSGGDQYYGALTPTGLPGGTYKLYVIDIAGHLAQLPSYAGDTSIHIYDQAHLPLYLIQYLASLGNTSSVSVQMLTDAGLTGIDSDHLSLYQSQLSSEDNTIGLITTYDELKAHIQSIIDTENQTYVVNQSGYDVLSTGTVSGTFDWQHDSKVAGTLYYVAVVHGAATPTQAQVVSGLDAGGLGAPVYGNFPTTADTPVSVSITALAGQAYDLYYVIDSGSGLISYKAPDNDTNGVMPAAVLV